jgi:probable RNA-binding protein EIF1AD
MAGLGRRSHYRKHLTDAVINDLPEPNFNEGERIAKVLGSRGGNLLEVEVAPPPSGGGKNLKERNSIKSEDASSQSQLALLPTKFRKLVWVKRGDFLIVVGDDQADKNQNETKDADSPSSPVTATGETIKVRYMVQHILYKDQVKHLKSIEDGRIWPEHFVNHEEENLKLQRIEDEEKTKQILLQLQLQKDNHREDVKSKCDDEYYSSDDASLEKDPDMFVNTNRIARLTVESDSDSDEEHSE